MARATRLLVAAEASSCWACTRTAEILETGAARVAKALRWVLPEADAGFTDARERAARAILTFLWACPGACRPLHEFG